MTDCENAIQGQVRGLGDWVLVPCVPTDAMLRAAQSAWLNDPMRSTTTTTITMWASMLAAAPATPAPGADDVTTKTELLPLPSGNVAHLIAAQVAEIEALRAEVKRLRADLMESDEIREKLGHILTRTAAALKGEPPAGVWHSWHDLPEKATQLAEALRKLDERAQRDEALLRQALEALLGQRGEPDWHTGKQRENAIASLCERLGVKA